MVNNSHVSRNEVPLYTVGDDGKKGLLHRLIDLKLVSHQVNPADIFYQPFFFHRVSENEPGSDML